MTILEYYKNTYDSLIEKRRKFPLTKNKKDPNYVYCETHHVIPKCLGGSNDKENLVNLTAREHFIAHKLLYKIAEKEKKIQSMFKLTYALCIMVFGEVRKTKVLREIFFCNSKKYESEKLKISKIMSKCMKLKPGNSLGYHYIRNIDTDEVKLVKNIEHLPDKWIAGGFIGKTNNTIWITDGITNKKIKKNVEIPVGWHKGRTICKQFRKISESVTKGSLNKVWIYDKNTQRKKYIDKEDLPMYIYDGSIWVKGIPKSFKEKISKAANRKLLSKNITIYTLKKKYGENFDFSSIDLDYYLTLSKEQRRIYREQHIENKK